MKALLAAIVLTCSFAHAGSSSVLVGPFNDENCPFIKSAFDDPSPLFLTVVRNNPRQADDFVRNYSRCAMGPTGLDLGWSVISANQNAIGWLKSTPDACRVVGEIGQWLHTHGVDLTGRQKAALSSGTTVPVSAGISFVASLVRGLFAESIAAGAAVVGSAAAASTSGNAADLANNANDCLRLGMDGHSNSHAEALPLPAPIVVHPSPTVQPIDIQPAPAPVVVSPAQALETTVVQPTPTRTIYETAIAESRPLPVADAREPDAVPSGLPVMTATVKRPAKGTAASYFLASR